MEYESGAYLINLHAESSAVSPENFYDREMQEICQTEVL